MRLNIGSGAYPLADYVNVDERPEAHPDRLAHVPPIPYPDGSAEEIWACHVLEHLAPAEARAFLAECRRVLAAGGRLGIVVPDTRAIMGRWLGSTAGTVPWEGRDWDLDDLDAVCAMFLYSTGQESPHRWSYDAITLRRAIETAGFRVTGAIDRLHDPRLGTGQWYQAGWQAERP